MIYSKSKQEQTLERAYLRLKEAFAEFAEKSSLTEEEKREFYNLLENAYIDSKLKNFLNHRMSMMSEVINETYSYALMRPNNSHKGHETSMVYVREISSKLLAL